MRDYGKVSPQFWIGGTGKLLRGNPDAQVLALYLMTNPHATMTGVFHCPIVYMAHETGMTTEGACKGLARLIEVGFCEYDEPSECVFVVNMAAYQIDDHLNQGDKRVLGLRKEVAKMVPARFQQRFTEVYGDRFHLVKMGEKQSPSEAPTKPLQSQEQEQEQEQEHEQEQEQEIKPLRKKSAPMPSGFILNDVSTAYAITRNLNIADEIVSFTNWHTAKGSTFKDWQAAWRTWCDKAVEFGRSKGGGMQATPTKQANRDSYDAQARAAQIRLNQGNHHDNSTERDITGTCTVVA